VKPNNALISKQLLFRLFATIVSSPLLESDIKQGEHEAIHSKSGNKHRQAMTQPVRDEAVLADTGSDPQLDLKYAMANAAVTLLTDHPELARRTEFE